MRGNFHLWWLISAAVLVGFAVFAGKASVHKSALAILIDNRGRFAMNRLQLVIWNLLILSSFAGAFFATLEIPTLQEELLILLGISVGTGATAGAVKSAKDIANKNIARVGFPIRLRSGTDSAPITRKFSQVFLEEEGAEADLVVSVTKFQNFVFTIVLAVIYIVLASKASGMPTFNEMAIWLIGISQGGYIAGKIPDRP